MRRVVLALSAALLFSGAANANGAACTCHNLESLQQETENAAYSADFFTKMAAKLKAREDELRQLKETNPTHPDASLSIFATSGQLRDEIMKTFAPPHAKVKDYTGPASVNLPYGSCKNAAGDLAKLRDGAPCKAIGDLTVAHEAKHSEICNSMGADTYWSRLPSELAAEEAARYTEQAKAMREELKHVIDGSDVEIETLSLPVLEGHGMHVVYKYEMKRVRIEGKSSPGSDRWELKGKSTRLGTIESMVLPGITCKSSGAMKDAISMKLGMDGFRMGLEVVSTSQSGDIKLKCNVPGAGKGMGQSMRPVGEGGNGQVFNDLPVQLETEHHTDIGGGLAGQAMAGSGMSVTGEDITKVIISCPAQ